MDLYETIKNYLADYPVFANIWSMVSGPIVGFAGVWIKGLQDKARKKQEKIDAQSAEMKRMLELAEEKDLKISNLEKKMDTILANQAVQSMGMKIPNDAKEAIVSNSKGALSTLKDKLSLEKIAEQSKEIIPEQLKDKAMAELNKTKEAVADRINELAERTV